MTLTSTPSILSLGAAGIYGLAATWCVLAMAVSWRTRQQRWHLAAWLFLALLFAFMAVLRVYGVEAALRADLRIAMLADGLYDERRSFQRPVAAGVLALIAAATFAWVFYGFRTVRGRRNRAVMTAGASACVLVGLVLLRLVSLSPVDALLYGPLKVNWILDVGASLAVLASAARYMRLLRRAN